MCNLKNLAVWSLVQMDFYIKRTESSSFRILYYSKPRLVDLQLAMQCSVTPCKVYWRCMLSIHRVYVLWNCSCCSFIEITYGTNETEKQSILSSLFFNGILYEQKTAVMSCHNSTTKSLYFVLYFCFYYLLCTSQWNLLQLTKWHTHTHTHTQWPPYAFGALPTKA